MLAFFTFTAREASKRIVVGADVLATAGDGDITYDIGDD